MRSDFSLNNTSNELGVDVQNKLWEEKTRKQQQMVDARSVDNNAKNTTL